MVTKTLRNAGQFDSCQLAWADGVGSVYHKDNEEICVEVSVENPDGRSKYSIVGELRYYCGEIRAKANELAKAGKDAQTALNEAVASTWDKMQDGSYTLRLGDGDNAGISPEQKLAAICAFYFPGLTLKDGTKATSTQVEKASLMLQAKFDAVKSIEKTTTNKKTGVVTTGTITTRPQFNEYTRKTDVKAFLDKHFASPEKADEIDNIFG